jgi:hypothetical protein
MKEIAEKAEKDCLQGKVYSNPYELYTDCFDIYERAWTQAQKQLSVGLLKPLPIESTKEYPLKLK